MPESVGPSSTWESTRNMNGILIEAPSAGSLIVTLSAPPPPPELPASAVPPPHPLAATSTTAPSTVAILTRFANLITAVRLPDRWIHREVVRTVANQVRRSESIFCGKLLKEWAHLGTLASVPRAAFC